MRIRKHRILSMALVITMLLTMLPFSAQAAGSGLSSSQTTVKPGDTFTVLVEVPAITEKLVNFKLSVSFDKDAFELTEFAPHFYYWIDPFIFNIK